MYIASTAKEISIHALRVEGDSAIVRSPIPDFPISIHALRVEGDQYRAVTCHQ